MDELFKTVNTAAIAILGVLELALLIQLALPGAQTEEEQGVSATLWEGGNGYEAHKHTLGYDPAGEGGAAERQDRV